MTYCLSLLCKEGIVFLSDSRTSAGLDNITIHPKMRLYERPGERIICLMSSGNLSLTQSVLSLMDEDIAKAPADEVGTSFLNQVNLYETVRYLGAKLRAVRGLDADVLRHAGVDFQTNFIVGGQIADQPPQIYRIYSEGNSIHASKESPFLQIGELKYGKPILDRGFSYDTPLNEAVKIGLLSLDSTMKSNLSVGTPFDIFSYHTDSLEAKHRARLDDTSPYLRDVRNEWQKGLVNLVHAIPELDFSSNGGE
ncbi:MAG: peptidase [Chthoniobacterales bacterium]